MAIKGLGPADFSLKENFEPVMLDDLARTICVAALDSEHCEIYPGFNVMEENLRIPLSATATFFVVESKDSTFFYDTHKAITIDRQPNLLDNLHALLSKNDI